jgi:hypothetical protein
MASLAQQHWEQHQPAAGNLAPVGTATPNPITHSAALQERYRLMFMRLQTDLMYIRAIRSRAGRNQRKRELLPEYADYLSIVLNSRATTTDKVLVQCCIWALDCGDYRLCLTLAEHAISHGMDSPDGFTRTLPEILLEEMAYQVNHADHPHPYTPYLHNLAALTAGQDITDEINAKFFKAVGKAQHGDNPTAALHAYRQAAHYGAKVQTIIRKLDSELETEGNNHEHP